MRKQAVLGRIFVIVGGLLVVALFGALIAPYFVDWTDFRRDFETQASRIIGKKVVVHGTVDARLLPFPTVTMTDVRIGEDSGGEALVIADKFSMESELAPFLSGEALIYNMHIEHPRVKLKLTEDGTLDWVKTGTPQIPASTVVLENVTISNGEVQFIDEQTGHDRIVTDLNLKLSAKTLAGPWKVAGSGALDKRPGSFVLNTSVPEDGKIFLKLRLLPENPAIVAEMEGSLALKALRPQYAGTFRLREKFRSESAGDEGDKSGQQSSAPRVSGDFELRNDRLRIGKYEFKMGDAADPYIVTGEATIDAGRKPEFLLTATGQQIDMTRFGATGEDTGKEQPAAIPLSDRLRAFLTLAADIPIPQMPGKATISLPALVTNDAVIRDIKLNMQPMGKGWQINEAEAQLPGRTTLSAKGNLTLIGKQSFEGDLLLASRQPSGFAEWVTGKVPDSVRKLKTAGFAARVSLTPELQRFENLEIAFGDASLKGRLEHQVTDNEPPALSTELTGNSFDLDTVLALGSLLTGEQSTTSLLNHKIGARLKFANFTAFGLTVSGLETTFTLANAGITNAHLSARDFYGASVDVKGGFAKLSSEPIGDAKISIKADDPTRILQLAAERLPAHPALKRLAESARYYDGSDFLVDLRVGEGDWPIEADLSGIAHGSRFNGKLAAQTLDLANSGGMTLDGTIENPDAWVMLGQIGLPTLPLDADQDGLLTLHVDQDADSDPQIKLAYTSSTTTVKLDGQTALDGPHFLRGSYTLNVDSGDFAPYLAMTGTGLPRLAEGLPFVATANIYSTADAIGLENISGTADENPFSGILSIDRKLDTPVFAGELHVKDTDLAWLAESIYGPVVNPVLPGLSAVPVPKDSGLPAALDIALSSDSFHLGALGTVEKFQGRLKAEPGRIVIGKGTGDFSTGKFTGNVELGNTEGNAFFRARLGIAGAALKTAFWQHGGAPVAAAKSDLSLILDATGTSPKAMLDTATGSGSLKLGNLAINGINSKALASILAGADAIKTDLSETLLQPIVEAALFGGALDFDKLDIPFVITGAKLRADKVIGKSADVSFEGQGTLALDSGRLDASLDATFNPGEQAVAGADPTVTLHWQGGFNAPDRALDITQMTSFLSLRRFEQERRRVEILQASMAEKQRLRREAALYRAKAAERQRLLEKRKAEERLLDEAQKKLGELAREEEAARKRLKEAQKLQEEQIGTPVQ